MIKSIFSNKLFFFIVVGVVLVLTLIFLALYQKGLSIISYMFLIEQNKSFECGFDQLDKQYLGFCVQYLNTAFLFLIVDLEIALLIPLFVNTSLYEKIYLSRFILTLFIIMTLLLMLIREVKMGGLK